MSHIKIIVLLLPLIFCTLTYSYNAYKDLEIIRAFVESKPPPKNHAKVARELVHKANWAATGTISTVESIKGYPMVNIISIADSGKNARSTGNIYFFLTLLDWTAQDVKANNVLTFLISDDEDLSCTNRNLDPMEPTCARVVISGQVVQLSNTSEEYKFANESFISRHPSAVNWIKAHNFFLCKLDLKNIFVLDFYGGPHVVEPEEYYKANLDEDYLFDEKYYDTNEI